MGADSGWAALLRAQSRGEIIVGGLEIDLPTLAVDQRLLVVLPATQSGLERSNIGITEHVQRMRRQHAAIARAADDHDLALAGLDQLGDRFFIVPLTGRFQDAARYIDRAWDVHGRELFGFTHIDDQQIRIGLETLFQIPGHELTHLGQTMLDEF
jgi:hypothetical protein